MKTITISATTWDGELLDSITIQAPDDHRAIEIVLTNSQMGKYSDNVLIIGKGKPDDEP